MVLLLLVWTMEFLNTLQAADKVGSAAIISRHVSKMIRACSRSPATQYTSALCSPSAMAIYNVIAESKKDLPLPFGSST